MPLVESGWGAVLDDLAARVSAAEAGDLAALERWAPPSVQTRMSGEDQHRATGILARQRELLSRLRDERAEVAAALNTVRRPVLRLTTAAAPVYVDRTG